MNSPTIVTLCGSTKFGDQFAKSQLDETLRGNIVLTIGCNMRTDQEIFKDFTRAKKWKRTSQYEYLFLDNPKKTKMPFMDKYFGCRDRGNFYK